MQTPTEAGFVVEMMNPSTLNPNPLNPAVHSARQKDALATSIEEFGWLAAPIYNATTKRLVDGHARVEEAKRRGEPSIPVRVIRVDEATEKRILASFNRIGNLVGYDDALLARLLQDCANEGDIPIGWNEDELGDLLLKIDRQASAAVTDIQASMEKEYGEGQPPSDEEEDEPEQQPSHVKMVQLFLTTETEPEFQEQIAVLKERWGTENTTDTVMRAVSDCCHEVWVTQ
jgi:ParB-like chromosome segregation protein Spo0J